MSDGEISRFENLQCLNKCRTNKEAEWWIKLIDARLAVGKRYMMLDETKPGALFISFGNVTVAEGNRLASTLAETLRDVDPGIFVDRQRERPDTQDFGASLAVILGTAAVNAVAKGIATWLARNSGAAIEIRRKGKVVLTASHLDSKDVQRIAEALSSKD